MVQLLIISTNSVQKQKNKTLKQNNINIKLTSNLNISRNFKFNRINLNKVQPFKGR